MVSDWFKICAAGPFVVDSPETEYVNDIAGRCCLEGNRRCGGNKICIWQNFVTTYGDACPRASSKANVSSTAKATTQTANTPASESIRIVNESMMASLFPIPARGLS